MSPSLCLKLVKVMALYKWKLVALIDVVMGEENNFPRKKKLMHRGRETTT